MTGPLDKDIVSIVLREAQNILQGEYIKVITPQNANVFCAVVKTIAHENNIYIFISYKYKTIKMWYEKHDLVEVAVIGETE